MEPTEYHNLWKTTGVFQYIYAEDNFKIEARNWNDLKLKLAIKGIKLQEKTSSKKNNRAVNKIHEENKTIKKQINPSHKSHQTETEYENEPLKKNRDYVESKEDVNFGKIIRPGEIERWGPDNSERARKLRKDILKY